MSFRVDFQHEMHEFEQFQDMMNFISDKLAVWNNFGIEQGQEYATIVVSKTPDPNALGVHVSDEAQTSDYLR